MAKELVISAAPHETRVAILEEGLLCEIYIEREKEFALVGSIYKGRVTRVLPGMQSAFVEIGLDSDAFLYVSDFLENLEEYDHVVSTVEGKVQKMEEQGGKVFVPADGEHGAVEPPEVTGGEAPAEAAPLPAESSVQPAPAPAPAPAPPAQSRPFERHDRDRGGFRDRGRDRGRGGRWSRSGGGGGGRGRGPDRRPGRDLPPSKYASSRPSEPSSYTPPPPGYEPTLLPGESLAKYKERPPAAPAAAGEPAAPVEEATLGMPPAAHVEETGAAASLPQSLYVSEPPAPEAPAAESEQAAEPAAQTQWEIRVEPILAEEPEVPAAPHVRTEADLTEEEVNTLSEQLAEAKHEERQDEAETAALAEETAAENGFAPVERAEEAEEATEHDEPMEFAGEPAGEEAAEEAIEEAAAPASEEAAPLQQEDRGTNQGVARIESRPRAHFQRPMRRGGPQRGGRFPRHQDRRHAPPRRVQLISEMLKTNQEIIVQIAKEPLGKKGARITSHVALPGRFLVYMPTVDHIGVSRKISSAEERSRLRRLVSEAKGTFPGGFIVRTAADSASDEDIRSDVEFLGRTWDEIRGRAEQRKAPALLHRDLNLVERILRDYLSTDYTAIWVDSEEEYGKVVEFVSRFQPKLVNRVKLYTKETPIYEEFGIQQELDKALRSKVWLKSGGYIVINHTEALVAIDVNTGKYVGKGSTRLEDTIVKTNIEAVKEIVRQIRLRDLGGIIVADFIDMEERRNRDKVMAALDDALRADRAPSKVLSFNEFGLVAITRKRTKQALERVLCQPCPSCSGSGMVKSVPTICYEILAEAKKMSSELDAQSLTLRVNPEIAKALKTRQSGLIEELEQGTRKSIIIQSDPTLHWEQYDIY